MHDTLFGTQPKTQEESTMQTHKNKNHQQMKYHRIKEEVVEMKKKREAQVLLQRIKTAEDEGTLMLFHNIIGLC